MQSVLKSANEIHEGAVQEQTLFLTPTWAAPHTALSVGTAHENGTLVRLLQNLSPPALRADGGSEIGKKPGFRLPRNDARGLLQEALVVGRSIRLRAMEFLQFLE